MFLLLHLNDSYDKHLMAWVYIHHYIVDESTFFHVNVAHLRTAQEPLTLSSTVEEQEAKLLQSFKWNRWWQQQHHSVMYMNIKIRKYKELTIRTMYNYVFNAKNKKVHWGFKEVHV